MLQLAAPFAALLARRAVLASDELAAWDVADEVFDAYETGAADFGDRCYWEDRAREASQALFAFDRGLATLLLALEA